MDFLLDFIVVLLHLLLSYVSWIKVVLHELFYPSKLQVLVHELRDEVRVHPMQVVDILLELLSYDAFSTATSRPVILV